MPLTIAAESPLSPVGRELIEGSQAALLEVYDPDAIFTMDPAELAAGNITFFVARDGGVPVGCVALVDCGGYGEIKRLYVSAAGRGRGIARSLMQHLETSARSSGLPIMRLETGPELKPAVALYRDLGYYECGRFGEYAEHPASLFMEKAL